jgi:carboxymethylenebutenolidase
MGHEHLTVRTTDGNCPCQLFTPTDRNGPWPPVIVYMDAVGIRPALEQMSQRLADAGYLVLLPDLFYRHGPYEPLVPKEVFAADFRAVLGPLMATTNTLKIAADTGALLSFLDTRADAAGQHVGAVGFCMGGAAAITAAGTWPARFAAVASFHGGNLATTEPTSPHRFAPELKAELYIAVAENDPFYPPQMGEQFQRSLDHAGVRYRADAYFAEHGWMMPDFPVYDPGEAERGWNEMLELLNRTLGSVAGVDSQTR